MSLWLYQIPLTTMASPLSLLSMFINRAYALRHLRSLRFACWTGVRSSLVLTILVVFQFLCVSQDFVFQFYVGK